ncbi:MAG: hypothetical protein QGI45_05835 [Myxococcota bacterium]|jgi:hypothetical protein|nr:hypothetical protein [Myxococcota bacterium]
MALYKLYPNTLEPSVCENILQSALESPLVGKSPLNAHFAQSRGFAFTAKAAGLTKIKTTCPYLEPALRAIFNPNTQHPTQRWFERPQEPNAFYINVLLLPATAAVGAHIDATLAKPNEVTTLRPKFVSVLYLNGFQTDEGGHLELLKGKQTMTTIEPQEGLLVRFAGHLKHAINAFKPLEPTSVRASIICEHYHFTGTKLASIPDYNKHRRQPFANYLKEAKGRDAQVDVEYG